MGQPFQVEIDIGTATPIRFTLAEEVIQNHRHLDVMSAILQKSPEDTDERARMWRGALEIVRRMLEKNAADPVQVFDGPDVWMIPDHAIRAVRIHDPESPDKRGTPSIGFRKSSE